MLNLLLTGQLLPPWSDPDLIILVITVIKALLRVLREVSGGTGMIREQTIFEVV